jgi:hypothetical protein
LRTDRKAIEPVIAAITVTTPITFERIRGSIEISLNVVYQYDSFAVWFL